MRIQHQTKLHNPEKGIKGNCLMTTYACYFDCSIEDVPNIEDLFDCQPTGFWYRALEMWLTEYKYKKEVSHSTDPFLNTWHYDGGWKDFYFAVGPSPRGVMHQVIYKDGKMFHDPHPSGAGLVAINNFITLEDI